MDKDETVFQNMKEYLDKITQTERQAVASLVCIGYSLQSAYDHSLAKSEERRVLREWGIEKLQEIFMPYDINIREMIQYTANRTKPRIGKGFSTS